MKLKLFGENERNNVFLGEARGESYIVKLESGNEKKVELSIEIAREIMKSNFIKSSRYVPNLFGRYLDIFEENYMTIQIKEDIKKTVLKNMEDIIAIGTAIGEFQLCLLNTKFNNVDYSDFYSDFMRGGIPDLQEPKRLKQIEKFYSDYKPDYRRLTNGIVHNDLNSNNLLMVGESFFFVDFEHVKLGPLISDLGVFILELWNKEKGVDDYLEKLNLLIKGFEKKINLTKYDKDNIIVFSLRYLYSDENWYNYWSYNGNPEAIQLIPDIQEKQRLLLKIIC